MERKGQRGTFLRLTVFMSTPFTICYQVSLMLIFGLGDVAEGNGLWFFVKANCHRSLDHLFTYVSYITS